MLKPLRNAASKSLPAALSLAIALSASHAVMAQTNDTEAPVLIHRQIDSGVAGELQTFLARVSDDFGVEEVVLHYRQGESGRFESIQMRPLLDSIGEYMIAIETSESAFPGLQYYINAVDSSGNTTNRGYSYAPIVLPLTAPAVVARSQTPDPVTQPATTDVAVSDDGGSGFNPTLVVIGVGALVALGALAAGLSGGGGDDGDDGEQVPTNPGTTPADTVTLTVISDQPSSN